MKFLYAFVGAIVGAIFAAGVVVLGVTIAMPGDDFGQAFGVMEFGLFGLPLGAILGIVGGLWVYRYVHGRKADRLSPTKKNILVTGLSLGAPFAAFLMVMVSQTIGGPPSDQQLLDEFQQHRPAFDQLIRMLNKDKRVQVIEGVSMGPENTSAPGVSPARIGAYRSLMSSISVKIIDGSSPQDQEITMLCYANGSAISSDEDKGYVYTTKTPKPLLKDLDECGPDAQGTNVYGYRHIQGNWYLYYDFLPG